ncbi:TRAP transporter large permease [Qiania dongpingensis]|uniref:TRAP transporter large permease n=1 Tax=Qiania dongpingensis TaxID=2763669 RepID=A0A7G9G224_9FIRM|nr:TRAP transporter large permease [Qiania dongpingensis]QNM04856.1 TRAP transporter large permease [Qiania dongpingensis]
MDPIWGLLLLLVLFLAGLPVTYALGFSALFIMRFSTGMKWITIGQQMMAGLNSFTILAVPLFLLAGKLMNKCGVTDRLFKFARAIVGWMPGGLGHVNILASFIFAGMSGTAIADASGLGLIEIKAMKDAGYDKDFSCAVTAASSTLGPIIPPSMPLVVYGTISGTSIGALFVAGVIPGIIMGVIMMALVFIYALIRKYPRDRVGSKRELLHACKEGFLPCMTPVIILLGIYTGIFTPTESAAIVVVYAAILGILVYREINFREFVDVLKETVADAIGICILISAATLFGNVLVKAMIPQTVMEFIVNSINNKYVFLLILNLALLLVGMFMETVSAITILTPIILPVAVAFGINPIHLGIIMVLNLMIGVVSPPFGVVLFAINKVGEISFGRLVKAMVPWFIVLLAALAIVTMLPWTCTWLPSTMGLGGL